VCKSYEKIPEKATRICSTYDLYKRKEVSKGSSQIVSGRYGITKCCGLLKSLRRKQMRTKMIGMLLLVLIAGLSGNLQAQTWNAYDQFDVTTPGGADMWQYGYYETSMSHFWYNTIFNGTVWGGPSTNIIHGLAGNDGDSRGSIHCNFGESISKPGFPNGMYWSAYSVTMQIGNTACIPALRFNVPANGTYQVHVVFEHNTTNPGLVTDVGVMVNGTMVSREQVSGFQDGPENFFSYNQVLNLSAGDYIEAVMLPDSGVWRRVAVMFEVTVGTLPEPTMNLVMKLDAGVGATDPNRPGVPLVDGDTVGLWEDQGPSGMLDASAKWGSPILKTDGAFPVIRFDGNDGMQVYDLAEPSDQERFLDPEDPNARGPLDLGTYTIYVVGKLNATDNLKQVFLSNYNTFRGYVLGISDSIPDYAKFWTNGGAEMRSGGAIDDTNRYYLLAATITNTAGKKLIVNDCVEDESYGSSSYSKTTAVTVGALAGGSQFLKGDIAEIRVYDGFIQATHDGVVNELVAKYGLNRECLGGPDPDVVALTYMTSYRCSAEGYGDYSYQTNTQYLDDAWDVILYDGPVSELDPNTSVALNNPDNVNIYIKCILGEPKTISFVNALTGPQMADGNYGMNFFFESSTAHQISVFGKLMDPGDTSEPFMENCSGSTAGYDISQVPGACSLVAKIYGKERKVTLTDWVMYNEAVWSLDMITAQPTGHPLDGPDGIVDHVGQFTLLVEEYQPVCTDLPAMGIAYLDLDYNHDCYINLEDFAVFAQNWLRCNDPANLSCE